MVQEDIQKLNKIFEKVLPYIKPTKEEEAIATNQVNEIVNRLRRVVPKDVEIRVVGSLIRGTNLKGFSDIDVFLLFNKKKKEKEIERLGLQYAKKIIGKRDAYEIKYAEHPYLRAHLYSIQAEADIVPAYKIESAEEMATTVDRSPLHEEFVNKHLTDFQRDQVRLLKYFLRLHDLYGAEVFTSGFSGYLCELLIYQFGDLASVLKFFANSKPPILLNPKAREIAKDENLVKKFNSQFVVIDPVDENRNVAAAVSMESLSKFVVLARILLERPSLKEFLAKGFSHSEAKRWLSDFQKRTGYALRIIRIKLPEKSEDILWPQLRKVTDEAKTLAEQAGFLIPIALPVEKDTTGMIVLFIEKWNQKIRFVRGPSVFLKEASDRFINKHKKSIGILFKEDVLYALETPAFTDIDSFLKNLLKRSKKHNDITLSKGRILKKIPNDCVDDVYAEMRKRFGIGLY